MITTHDYTDLYNPRRPYSANILTDGLYKHDKQEALNHRFTQTTSKKAPNLIVLDFDVIEADWFVKSLIDDDGLLPPYSYLTTNPATTHAQAGWFIDGTAGTQKAKAFFDDIHAGLKTITGSDPNYTGFIGRNPLHPHQQTQWGTDNIYTLADLKQYIPQTARKHLALNPQRETTQGRNTQLFNSVRKVAYSLRNENKYNTPHTFTEVLTDIARTLNQQHPNPLTDAEVLTVVKSISRWTWENLKAGGYDYSPETQKQRSLKAAQKRTGKAADRYTEVLTLHSKGYTITNLAEHYNITYGGAKTLLRRAKQTNPQRSGGK